MALKYLQVQQSTLSGSGVTASATSIILSSFKHLPVVGAANVVTSDLGDICYATLEPGTDREELVSFTGVTQNANGTATLTGVIRNLKPYYPYDQHSSSGYAHAGGSYLVVSDNPQLFADLVGYIDSIAISGAPNASTSAKGISELGTAAQIDADTATGETGAPLVTSPDNLAASKYGTQLPSAGQKQALGGTVGTPATSNEYVTKYGLTDLGADQSQTTANATTAFGEADATTKRNKVAQSFVAGADSFYLRGVALRKAASTGTFTGTVTVSIQADDAGSPSGTALITKTISNNAWRGVTDSSDAYVLFSSELAITPGATYWIVAEASTADNANCPNLATDSAGGYASGALKYRNATDGWTAVTGVDLYFKTLDGLGGRGLKDAAYNTGSIRDALGVSRTKCFDDSAWVNVSGNVFAIFHGLGKKPHEIQLDFADSSTTDTNHATAVIDVVGSTYWFQWTAYNEATHGAEVREGGAWTASSTNVFKWGAGSTPPNALFVVSVDENVVVVDGGGAGFTGVMLTVRA